MGIAVQQGIIGTMDNRFPFNGDISLPVMLMIMGGASTTISCPVKI